MNSVLLEFTQSIAAVSLAVWGAAALEVTKCSFMVRCALLHPGASLLSHADQKSDMAFSSVVPSLDNEKQ